MGEHSCETERNLLRELFAVHSDFETVSEIDVYDLSGATFQKDVGRMSVTQAQDMANHAVDGKGPSVCRSSFKPMLRIRALQPQHTVKVLSRRILQSIFKDFDLLQKAKAFVIRSHLQKVQQSFRRRIVVKY